MSCGGGKHGNYGLVSYAAAIATVRHGEPCPVSRVARLYHTVIPDSIREDEAAGRSFPDPSAETVVAWLNDRITGITADRNIPASRKATIRDNLVRRRDLILEEVAAGGHERGEGGSVVPTGRQWEAWHRLNRAVEEDHVANACSSCGKYRKPGHVCAPRAAVKQERPAPPPLRDLMGLPGSSTTAPGSSDHEPDSRDDLGHGDQRADLDDQGTVAQAAAAALAQTDPDEYGDGRDLGEAERCPQCGQFAAADHVCPTLTDETPRPGPQQAARPQQAAPAPTAPAPLPEVPAELATMHAFAQRVLSDPEQWVTACRQAGYAQLQADFASRGFANMHPDRFERGREAALRAAEAAVRDVPIPPQFTEDARLELVEATGSRYRRYATSGYPPEDAARITVDETIDATMAGLRSLTATYRAPANMTMSTVGAATGTVRTPHFVPLSDVQAMAYAGSTFDTADANAPMWRSLDGGAARCRVCGQFTPVNGGLHTCPGPHAVDPQTSADQRPAPSARIEPPHPTATQAPVHGAPDVQTSSPPRETPPPTGYARCAACRNHIALNADGTMPVQCPVCASQAQDAPLPADTVILNPDGYDPGTIARTRQRRSRLKTATKVAAIAAAVVFLPYAAALPLIALYLLTRSRTASKDQLADRVDRGQAVADQMGVMAPPARLMPDTYPRLDPDVARSHLADVYADAEPHADTLPVTTASAWDSHLDDSSTGGGGGAARTRSTTPVRRYPLRTRALAWLTGAHPSDLGPTPSLIEQLAHMRQTRRDARLIRDIQQRRVRARLRTADQPPVPAGSSLRP